MSSTSASVAFRGCAGGGWYRRLEDADVALDEAPAVVPAAPLRPAAVLLVPLPGDPAAQPADEDGEGPELAPSRRTSSYHAPPDLRPGAPLPLPSSLIPAAPSRNSTNSSPSAEPRSPSSSQSEAGGLFPRLARTCAVHDQVAGGGQETTAKRQTMEDRFRKQRGGTRVGCKKV